LPELDIDSKQVSPSLILGIISDAKNRMQSAKNFSEHVDSYIEEIASRCYEKYEEFLIRSNSLDFDDLLLRCLNLFQNNKFILDKYQNSKSSALMVLAGILETDLGEIKNVMHSCAIENIEKEGEWISIVVKNKDCKNDK